MRKYNSISLSKVLFVQPRWGCRFIEWPFYYKPATPKESNISLTKRHRFKKSLFVILKSNQIIWYILGLIEVLLIFRLVLKGLGASLSSGFTGIIYAITAPLALPFAGILRESVSGNSIIEWSTIIAIIVYICLAWGIVYLIDLIYPITPKDVENKI